MQRRVLVIVGIAALVIGGVASLPNWENVQRPEPQTPFDMLRVEPAETGSEFRAIFERERTQRAECEKETQDWRYRDCMGRIAAPSIFGGSFRTISRSTGPYPSLIRRANEGEIDASLEYGYHIVGKAAVENTEPLAAIPYLMTAALAGDVGAHVQLGLIEAVSRKDGDLVKAWAHFDIALREMPPTAPDYRRSQMHFDEIDESLSETERESAKALSADYSETMRVNRNALK